MIIYLENSTEITTNIINTINEIFANLFSSIDNSLYEILDNLVFINSEVLTDKYFYKIFGTTSNNGILLIANSLLIGFILYYSIKLMMSNFTYQRTENPLQFIFKCIIFGICMNSSFFIVEQIIDLNVNVCSIIKNLGEDMFRKKYLFYRIDK